MMVPGRKRRASPENDIAPHFPGLHGAVLTVDMNGKKLSMRFEGPDQRSRDDTGEAPVQDLLASLDDIVDDFVSFFERSIYRKERFTRIVPC